MTERIRTLKHLLFLTSVIFILYANILPNPFVWDDNIFILQNLFIRDWKNIPLLFQSEFFSKSPQEKMFEKGGYYRPLVMLLYTLEYPLWGENPFGYHLVSILLHVLNVFLVYHLIHLFFRDRTLSFISALLFASHPLHTEAVSYLPSRGDLLVTAFSLLAFLTYLSSRRHFRALSLLFFLMALLCKEIAMVFPLLLFVHDLSLAQKRSFRLSPLQIGHWVLLFCYLFLRLWAFPFPLKAFSTEGTPLFLRILSIGELIFSYFLLLIFPYPLHLERHAPVQTRFLDMGTLLFVALLAGMVWLGKRCWRKNRILFVMFSWFWIGLLPVLNVVPLFPSMAEHYLYFPSIGFFAFASFALKGLFDRVEKGKLRKGLLLLGCLIPLLYGIGVIGRNKDFSDDVKLFTHTIRYSPQSARIYNNLGSVYVSRRFLKEAERAFEKSLALDPNQPLAWANLGTLYREKKEYEKAIDVFQKALKQDEQNAAIWNKLGIAYAEIKKGEKAVQAFKRAMALDPTFVEAYFNLGSYYWKKKELSKTLFYWEEAFKMNPNHPELKRWLPLVKTELAKGG